MKKNNGNIRISIYCFLTISLILCNTLSHGITPTSGSSSESDPCGNDVGNGNEIAFGQVTPTEWNPDNPFRSLAVHPNNPDIVIIGTEANGFVKSIDGGQTWSRYRYGLRHGEASGEQLYPEVYDLAFSESNPDIIYAATTGGPGPLAGPDGGEGGIYKSVDGGQTWERKNCGLDNEWIHSVHVSPDNPDLVVIGISGGETSGWWGGVKAGDYFDGGIFRTIDGGENWIRVNLAANDNKNKFQYIRSQRNAPSVLYTFGFNWEGTSPNIGFYKSTDAGETWNSFATVLRDRNITYFDISDNGEVIYAVDEMKILKSTDSGETWSEYDLHSSGYVVSVFPGDSEKLLFSRVDGVYLSEDGLLTETKVIDVKGRHPSDIAIAPSDSNIVYAIDVGYDVYKSVNSGRTFSKLVNLREDVLNVDMTVGRPCEAATLSSDLSMHIPHLEYQTLPDEMWLRADFRYMPGDGEDILFTVTDFEVIAPPLSDCAAATLSADLSMYLSQLNYQTLLVNFLLWVDLEYREDLSSDDDIIFKVTDFGVID